MSKLNLTKILFFIGCSFLCLTTVSAVKDHNGNTGNKVRIKSYQTISLEALYQKHPEIIYELFRSLNLNYPGLSKVKKQVEQKNWVNACRALIRFYKEKSKQHTWFENSEHSNIKMKIARANNVLKNIFTFQGVTAQQPTWSSGGLNWYNQGPRNDREWAYFLNRHGYFNDLLGAYRYTSKSIYAKKFNSLIIDWILQNPVPYKQVWTVTWRQLEVGIRLISGHWPRAFYGFQSAPEFTAAARILMLSSIPEQANYIMHYHVMHSNWTTMELNGLASTAFYWPEFKNASKWINHAIAKMKEELEFEVYPDGAQNELASHYHKVALKNIEQFYNICKRMGRKLPEIRRAIIKMYQYLAYTMRPNGFGLLNNDSDLDYNRNFIAQAADKYNQKDWKYIASNGKKGLKPPVGPSVFFPWAGHMIMRSGWHKQAKWAFFDIGPWGTGHQHNDKLHLSVAAFGHDWLVDSGRYYYKWDKWRRYFLSSRAHNVILIDGKGERPYGKLAKKPKTKNYSSQNGLVFSMGTYNNGYSSNWWNSNSSDGLEAKHTRAVLFINKRYWVVIDHVKMQKPETVAALWHFAPKLRIKRKENMVVATDSSHNSFQLIPTNRSKWNLSLIHGQKNPRIQGWYSRTYNNKIPNYCVRYRMMVPDTSATFAWLLYPSKAGAKKIDIQTLKSTDGVFKLQLEIPDIPETRVVLRLYGDKEIPLPEGNFLDGRAAVIAKGQKPMVVSGVIRNQEGKVIVRDSTNLRNVINGKLNMK